jgi:hypothetical protein
VPERIINIGEIGAPLNGALWATSSKWALGSKMRSDFSDGVIAELENNDQPGVVQVNDGLSPVKATLLGGGWGVRGLMVANAKAGTHTGKALLLAGKKAFGWMFRK